MVLITHIIIAVSSLLYTTYVFFTPSKTKLRAAYGLIGATLVSGTYLVVSTHAPMIQSCQTGLIYLGVVLFGVFSAKHKLANQLDA